MLHIEGITHWALPVNDLTESEEFYRDLLGLEHKGRLPGGSMSCVAVDGLNILLCQRKTASGQSPDQFATHHSFTVNPATFEDSVRILHDRGVTITQLVYREKGFFTGRELYFLDPSGNRLELRDPTWVPGMPNPTIDQIVAAGAPVTS